METHFTADLHFGHGFMSELRGFPRTPTATHDAMILELWNNSVGVKDEVWFLGDFSFHNKQGGVNYSLFKSLHGRKHLVRGNHDPAHVCELPWSSVSDLVRRKFNGRSFVMCHYPMLTWQNAHHGSWHLHGHSHGNLHAPTSTRMDVGLDTHPEFRPYRLDEIETILSQRNYDFVDHHTED